MPERGHRAALDQPHATVLRAPLLEPLPGELRPPAKPPRDRREAALEQPAKAGLRAQVIDQDDLAARPHHARELVERPLRIRHRRDDVLRYDHVEITIGKAK